MIDWDEALGLWRARHYKLAVRIIGHAARGTKGTPVDSLTGLLNQKYFPELWWIRSILTEQGPLSSVIKTVDGDGYTDSSTET
ncbi:hypothetical protein [Nocardia testacea]|uniref:hypothetical protein n=1 Tax=Nocardia testacea TaxID=248551 RepID=UPI0006883E2E|nr:hypothetical protein [Nocardia testacea]